MWPGCPLIGASVREPQAFDIDSQHGQDFRVSRVSSGLSRWHQEIVWPEHFFAQAHALGLGFTYALAFLMVVLNRIAYLRELAGHGAKLLFTISVNPSTGVQKFKVLCDPTVQVFEDMQFSSFAILDLLSSFNSSHRVADRGHKHSNGISEITF